MTIDDYSKSPYFQLWLDATNKVIDHNIGSATPQQIADFMNRKITPAFRRAVKHACDIGELQKVPYITTAGGVSYYLTWTDKQWAQRLEHVEHA